MAAKKKKRPSGKTFRFQLSLGGMVGIGIVSCCLFLWMFLLGVWAGQTILLPAAKPVASVGKDKPQAAIVSGTKAEPGKTAEKK